MYCWYNPKDLLHLRVFIYELVNNNRGNLRVVSLDERVWGPLSTKFPEL